MKQIAKNDIFQLVAERLAFTVLEHGYGTVGRWWNATQDAMPVNRLHVLFGTGGIMRDRTGDLAFKRGLVFINPIGSSCEQIWQRDFKTFYLHFRLELYPTQDIFAGTGRTLSYTADASMLSRLIALTQSKDLRDSIEAKALCLMLIAPLIAGSAQSLRRRIAVGEKYRDVFRAIDDSVSARVPPAEYAAKLGRNARSLMRSFRSDTGFTLKAYINRCLIERARYRLIFTDMKVKDIAHELGFNDELYFSRFFKRHTRTSPADHRTHNRGIIRG